MLKQAFYDPSKSYEENFEHGPFGEFADGRIFDNPGQPEIDFLGQKVFCPFGIAAGPLVNGKFVKAALQKGFDLPVYKTVRTKKFPCHPWPNVLAVKVEGNITVEKAGEGLMANEDYQEPLSITNSFGVPSFDADFWQKDMADAVKSAGLGQAVIGSFQGTPRGGSEQDYVNDFVLAARLVKETGAKILEVNLSCPNEGTAHLLCFDIARARKVVDGIKNEIGNTPLMVKIAYFVDNDQLQNFVESVGKIADAIAAINTIPAKIVKSDGSQALPGEGRLYSGTCGAGIKWAGLEMVKRLKTLREKLNQTFRIIGVGGVMNASDYREYIAVGADAVMSATGAMWNPLLGQEIKDTN